jgi:hypothetical protein
MAIDIQKLIEKLPIKLQPIAQVYVSSFIKFTDDEIVGFIDSILSGDWITAYRKMQSKLSNEEIAASQDRLIEVLKQMNRDMAVESEQLRTGVRDFLLILFQSWRAGLIV